MNKRYIAEVLTFAFSQSWQRPESNMNMLRFALLVLVPTIAVISLLASNLQRELVHTHDWHDVTVLGKAYIGTTDEYDEDRIWLRSARLTVDEFGQICALIDGQPRRLDPLIQVPMDWQTISINLMGEVTINAPGRMGERVGQIALCTFVEADNEEILHEKPGRAPVIDLPSDRTGFVLQGCKMAYVLPITAKTASIVLVFSIWILLVFLQFRGAERGEPIKTP
jgi:hypothetical protein